MTLSEYARTWIGKSFAGQATEQCMLFVRHCLTEVDASIKNKVTDQAVDGLETSYALASSLAGPDCGHIKTTELQVNDIVFFKDTYGNWPEGTITHVGIMVDNNGGFVHRPTSERPVEQAHLSGYWDQHFRCGLGWMNQPVPVGRKLKWFLHDGKSSLLIDGKPNSSPFVLSNYDNSFNLNNKGRKLLWAKVEVGFDD